MATITFELSKRVNELGHQELKLRFKHNPIAQRVKTGIFIKAEYFDKVTSIQEPQFRSNMDLSTNIERVRVLTGLIPIHIAKETGRACTCERGGQQVRY